MEDKTLEEKALGYGEEPDSLQLQLLLAQHGLKMADDDLHVQWAMGNRRHPRNWSISRKAYDIGVVVFLELFTYVLFLFLVLLVVTAPCSPHANIDVLFRTAISTAGVGPLLNPVTEAGESSVILTDAHVCVCVYIVNCSRSCGRGVRPWQDFVHLLLRISVRDAPRLLIDPPIAKRKKKPRENQTGIFCGSDGLNGQNRYLIGQAIGGILFPPYSEAFGRKKLYIVSTALYSISCLIVAAVPSLSGVILGRFMSGLLSAIPTTVVIGSIEDMFNSRDRIWMVCIWAIVSNLGLVVGPIMSIYILVDLEW